VIEPDVAGFDYDDFTRSRELIRVGAEAMRSALPTVRQWFEAPVEATNPQKAIPLLRRPAPMPAD